VFAVSTVEDWAADGLGTLDPKVMAEDMGGPFAAASPLSAIARRCCVRRRVHDRSRLGDLLDLVLREMLVHFEHRHFNFAENIAKLGVG